MLELIREIKPVMDNLGNFLTDHPYITKISTGIGIAAVTYEVGTRMLKKFPLLQLSYGKLDALLVYTNLSLGIVLGICDMRSPSFTFKSILYSLEDLGLIGISNKISHNIYAAQFLGIFPSSIFIGLSIASLRHYMFPTPVPALAPVVAPVQSCN